MHPAKGILHPDVWQQLTVDDLWQFLGPRASKFQGKRWFDPAFPCRVIFGPCARLFAKTADFRAQFIRALLSIRVHIYIHGLLIIFG